MVAIFFFFLRSKNVTYMKGYSVHEEHRADPEEYGCYFKSIFFSNWVTNLFMDAVSVLGFSK